MVNEPTTARSRERHRCPACGKLIFLFLVLRFSPRAFKCPGCDAQIVNDEPPWLALTVGGLGGVLPFLVIFIFLYLGPWAPLASIAVYLPLLFLPGFVGRIQRISDEEIRRRRSFAFALLALLVLAVIVAGLLDSGG